MIIEKIVEQVKKLPGVSYVLVAMTYLGARSTGVEELAGAPLAVACVICALGYWIGSKLDHPVYDKLYGPDSRYGWLPKYKELYDARDKLAIKVFQPRDVQNYADARKRNLVNSKQNLYTIAKNAAEGAKAWEGFISNVHDFSKAARSFFVIATIIFAVLLGFAAFPETVPKLLAESIHRLGFWSNWIVYVCLIPLFLFTYIYLRALHQIYLYRYVADNVKLLPMPDGKFVPVIPEIMV